MILPSSAGARRHRGCPGRRAAGVEHPVLHRQSGRGGQHAVQPGHRRHGQGPPGGELDALGASGKRPPTGRASSTGRSTGAGLAVWSLRAQADRRRYQEIAKHTLNSRSACG